MSRSDAPVAPRLLDGVAAALHASGVDLTVDAVGSQQLAAAAIRGDGGPETRVLVPLSLSLGDAGLIVDGERLIPENALAAGNFEVIVSGFRKGVGSSRETAAQCEAYSGIRIAIAASFAPIHARNNINQGVLMGGTGPTYETASEVQFAAAIGDHEYVGCLGIGLSVRPVNPRVPLWDVRGHEQVGKKCTGIPDIKSDMKAAVHVQADKITAAFGIRVTTTDQAKRKTQASGLDQIKECVIEEAVQQACDPPVGYPRHRLEHYVMLGPSHLGPGNLFVNGAISEHVSPCLNPVDPERIQQSWAAALVLMIVILLINIFARLWIENRKRRLGKTNTSGS